MNKLIVVVGLILIIVGGLMLLGIVYFNETKSFSWDSVAPGIAPELYLDKQPVYVNVDLTNLQKGAEIKVTVTPTQSDDSILLLLMTPQAYQQFLASTVGKSDVLVWQEPTTTGESVSLDYTAPYTGNYVLVLRAWQDANKDGIPFQFSMEIFTPLDLTLPGLGVAAVGLILLVFGFIRKPAVPPPPPPSQELAYAAPPPPEPWKKRLTV